MDSGCCSGYLRSLKSLCFKTVLAFISQKEPCDPQESFRVWLQRKQQQQQRERQLMEVKKLEQDCGHLLRSREDCERAFKL